MKLALTVNDTPVLMPDQLPRPSGRFGIGFIQAGIEILIVVAIITCLFYLVYGGFKVLMSGGNPKKFEAAKTHLTYSIIGLVIVFLSFLIVNVITYFFGFELPLDKLFK